MLKLMASIAAASAAVLFLLSLKSPSNSQAPSLRLEARGLSRPLQQHRALSLQQYHDPQSTEVRTTDEDGAGRRLLVPCPNLDEPVPIPEFYSYDPEICYHDFPNTVYYHVGKGGGGTVESDLINHGRLKPLVSHPNPYWKKKFQYGPFEKIIINIRDPVDRYQSAFFWELGQCQYPGKENYDFRCPNGLDEWNLVSERYEGNANVLAEALCEESPSFQQATDDFSSFYFSGHKRPLTGWLDFLIDPNKKDSFNPEVGIQQVYAVPMEKPHMEGQGKPFLEQHVQRLSFHLLEEKYGTETATALMMHAPSTIEHEHNMHHSTGKTPSLSPLGECCMARNLRGDYQIIQTMLFGGAYDDAGSSISVVEPLLYAHPALSGACSWGTEDQQELCRSDLKSMLSRRARYLDLSLGTCSNVVSNMVVNE